uniref:Importin alpha n=1 Tax=Ditylenchus dipsaci TaxID=166011 RepID=A0A915DWU8_9BILA
MAVIQTGATKSLINMCSSQSAKLSEQAIWAVANIAGDSVQLRDHVIEEGLVPTLQKLMLNLNNLSVSFVRTLAWTYSNLVRHKNPQLPYGILKDLAPGIAALLKFKDLAVQQDSGWALSYMTTAQIKTSSWHTADGLIAPALRVLGNFATGSDTLTQVVVDSGVMMKVIPSLLKRTNVSIVKECCWLVSNVVAGTEQQIQHALDADLLPLLFDVLKTGDHRSQFEASWPSLTLHMVEVSSKSSS